MRRIDPGDAAAPRLPPGVALTAAVVAISWAGPLVRFATAPALAVATWRLVLCVLMIAAVLAVRGRGAVPRLRAREWALAAAAGLLLAAHFWSWITSLELTSVASSVVLVSTQPLFVAALSVAFLGERPAARQWGGILIGTAGAAVVGWGDWALGPTALLGDALALAGAVFASGYLVIGRRLRARLDLWHYTGVVYGIAALALAAAAALHPGVALTGYPAGDWWVFLALAAGPMLVGHTGMNYALRYVPAYLATLVVLAEPIGATLIAWLVPAIGEVPAPRTLLGGGLILGGIALGTIGRRTRTRAPRRAATA